MRLSHALPHLEHAPVLVDDGIVRVEIVFLAPHVFEAALRLHDPLAVGPLAGLVVAVEPVEFERPPLLLREQFRGPAERLEHHQDVDDFLALLLGHDFAVGVDGRHGPAFVGGLQALLQRFAPFGVFRRVVGVDPFEDQVLISQTPALKMGQLQGLLLLIGGVGAKAGHGPVQRPGTELKVACELLQHPGGRDQRGYRARVEVGPQGLLDDFGSSLPRLPSLSVEGAVQVGREADANAGSDHRSRLYHERITREPSPAQRRDPPPLYFDELLPIPGATFPIRARRKAGTSLAKLIPRTEESLPGPWFLDTDSLQKLDEALAGQISTLEQDRQAVIDSELESKLAAERAYREAKGERTLKESQIRGALRHDIESGGYPSEVRPVRTSYTFFFKGGHQLVAPSFREISENRGVVTDWETTGFVAGITGAGVEATVSLSVDRELNIAVRPRDRSASEKVFGALLNWADSHKPRTPMRVWKQHAFGLQMISFLLCFGTILFVAGVRLSSEQYYKDQGRQLLQQPVVPEQEALRVLLALAANQPPPADWKPTPRTQIRWWWLVIVAYSIALSFPPPNVVGIGKARRQLWWKRWATIVLFTGPAFVVAQVFQIWVLPALR